MIYLYIELVLFLLLLIAAPYQLWCDYIGVMNAKRVREIGKAGGAGLSNAALYAGSYMLIRGYLLDFFCNTIHASILLLEFPQEMTVTRRIRRHVESGSGWRYEWCLKFRTQLLDGFDPAGIHQ